MSNDPPQFLFVCCQAGAERALKGEIARNYPHFTPAFSRPGLVTFKMSGKALREDEDLQSMFARCYGFSLGSVQGTLAESMVDPFWEQVADRRYTALHVWERDSRLPGEREFQPGPTVLSDQVGKWLRRHPRGRQLPINRTARPGQWVLDCILVEPQRWLVGEHRVGGQASRWPGGVPLIRADGPLISRAYLKTREALQWADFPMRPGDIVAEIGSAPGGSSQALLEDGFTVWGVDPAEMDPQILEDPAFRHIRMRVRDVKRREFTPVKWLLADSNVTPKITLDMLQGIVSHPGVHIQGLLLTLKLSDDVLAEQIPEQLERIRGWGYRHIRARQLAFNRRELCVAALRRRYLRRQANLGKSGRADPPESEAPTE